LRHHGEQTYGLEADGLAASVRSTDDQLTMIAIQLQRERNDLRGLALEISLEDRMPGVAQNKRICGIGFEKLDGRALVIFSETRLSELSLEFGHGGGRDLDGLRLLTE